MIPGLALRLLTCLSALFLFGSHVAIAQVSIPSGWTSTSVALSRAERASVAQAALEVMVQAINNSTGESDGLGLVQSVTLLSTLADYDYQTGGTTFKSTVINTYVALAPLTKITSANSDSARWGRALTHMHRAYPDQTFFLNDAITFWNRLSISFVNVSVTDSPTQTLASSNATFNSSCETSTSGGKASVEGAMFFFSGGNTQVNGETIGPWITLSSYLYHQTTNNTYADAARLSVQFAKNFLSNGTMVFDTMDVGTCSLTPWTFTYNGGYVVEGISSYLNVTNDQSVFTSSDLSTLVQGLVLFPGWTGANGVIFEVGYANATNATSAGALFSGDWKAILVNGLYVTLETGSLSSDPSLSALVQQYINIQYNAVVGSVNSSINGQQVYSISWVGQRLNQYVPVGQLAATQALNAGLALASNGTTSSNSTTTANPQDDTPSQSRTNVGAIVGGVVGGVGALCVIALAAFFYRRSKRERAGTRMVVIPEDTMTSEPFMLTAPSSVQASAEAPSMQTVQGYTASGQSVPPTKLQRHRFMPSVSGLTDTSGSSSRDTRAVSATGEDSGLSQPQVIQVEAGLWRQVLESFNDVRERLDRRDDETVPPPMYEDATYRV